MVQAQRQMFPSNNSYNYNYNGIDPTSKNDQQVPNSQFLNDIITTTNLVQDDFPLPSFYFPSPLLPSYEFELDDYGFDLFQQDINDLFHHNQPLIATNTNNCNTQEVTINEVTEVSTKELQSNHQHVPIKRRPSKRDRHSKINTAQGPRDRRMRLSFKVAKEFFGVQDKLGFDKASKTVEWLLIQAKPSIEKLFNSLPEMANWSFEVASLPSECEVLSSVDEAAIEAINIFKEKPSTCGEKKRMTRSSHKTTTQQLARESRDKARARARKRTLEKMWIASEASKGTDVQGHDMNHPSNLEILSGVNAPLMSNKQGDLIDDSMAIMEEWSPSSILSYMQSSDASRELQFRDFQAF